MNTKTIANALFIFIILGSFSGCIKVEIVNSNESGEPKVEFLAPSETPTVPATTQAGLAPVFDCRNVTEIASGECEALVSLYNHTNGEGWVRRDGWLTTATPCSWYGVACNFGHVSSLELADNGLYGDIPPKIVNLSNLVILDLSNNGLSGNIPPKIGNLTNLVDLNLSNNRLNGNIPPEIGNLTNLLNLDLTNNELSESIPTLAPTPAAIAAPSPMAPTPAAVAAPLPMVESVDYSTFLGGNGDTLIYSVAVCPDGSLVAGGSTNASNLPVTPGAFDTTFDYTVPSEDSGQKDGFIAKFDAAGTLIFLTYLGGSSADHIYSIAVDEQCSIYTTGSTHSQDFPTTENAYDRALKGDSRDTFVSKLSSDGSTLLYSTFLSGTDWDYGLVIAVDDAHNAYIGGFTHGGFPVTAGAADGNFGSPGDGFVAKLDPLGSQLVYATYVGRDGDWDSVDSLAVDDLGAVYVAHSVHSADGGGVTKISPDGSWFEYDTPLPGQSAAVAVDSQRNAYLAGWIESDTGLVFPVTADAFQSTFAGGSRDLTIARLDQNGILNFATYFGGSGLDSTGNSNCGVAIDAAGNVYITGSTNSTDIPLVQPFQSALGGDFDAFVVKFNIATGLVLSSYLGGSAGESSYGDGQNFFNTAIAVDYSGNIYLAGRTDSPDFPTTPNAFDTTFNGPAYDGFLTKISIQ
jgi:hypothetical protein